jgi:alkylation response protein AidB-like acyl-CoA dehydrogenase
MAPQRAAEAEQRDAKGVGLFLVPTDSPGYTVEARENTMGLRPVEIVTVQLDQVRLGADALLGDADRGFSYAMQGLDLGRLGIAACAVGLGQGALVRLGVAQLPEHQVPADEYRIQIRPTSVS